jgi:hypothetical protein
VGVVPLATGHHLGASSLTITLAIWLIANDLWAVVAVAGTPSQSRTCLATIDIPSDQDLVSAASMLVPQNAQVKKVNLEAISAETTRIRTMKT